MKILNAREGTLCQSDNFNRDLGKVYLPAEAIARAGFDVLASCLQLLALETHVVGPSTFLFHVERP